MKPKTLIILFILSCLLAVITFFTLNTKKDSAVRDGKTNNRLLGELPLDDITAITIVSPEASVKLKKKEPVWIVENRFNYPADFSMIADLVKKLKDVKTGMSFAASKETVERLALQKPGSKEVPEDRQGIRIILKDSDEKILSDIILGKLRNASSRTSSQYVMPAKENTIYLIDNNFRFLEKRPSEWIRKDLIKIDADRIESISCYSPLSKPPLYTLKRPGKGEDPEFVNLPPGKKVVKSKIHEAFNALSALTIEDITNPVQDADKGGDNNAYCLEYHLFDGTVYKIYPGRATDKGKFFLKAEVSYVQPTPKTGDASSALSEKAEGKDLAAEAESQNKRLNPWTYIIPEWIHESFITDLKEFSEQ